MKCNDILNRGNDNYRHDCAEEYCPYAFTPESCRFSYTGKVKVKEMLIKLKRITDDQYIDLNDNITDYNTEQIGILATVAQTIEKELKELK